MPHARPARSGGSKGARVSDGVAHKRNAEPRDHPLQREGDAPGIFWKQQWKLKG